MENRHRIFLIVLEHPTDTMVSQRCSCWIRLYVLMFRWTKISEANPFLLIAGIILIPLGVAAVSLFIDARIDNRQRQLSKELFERQERLSIAQMIDAYFQGIGDVMNNQMDAGSRNRIIVARTMSLLNRLSKPSDKAMVLRFVTELQPGIVNRPERTLERSSKPFVDLSRMDLRDADLSFANLYRADLSGAQMTGVNLTWANLTQARLEGAILDQANLNGAQLAGAEMTRASLRRARLGGADFTNAELNNGDLRGADLSDFSFDGITSSINLSGTDVSQAIWVDGSRCRDRSVGRCKRQ